MQNNTIKSLLANYLLEEGKYDIDNYSQNIEIINSIPESIALEIGSPRIVLISEQVNSALIDKFRGRVQAVPGRLNKDGRIEINFDSLKNKALSSNIEVSRYLPKFPFLNEDAAVIGYYDWSKEGLNQIVTLLKNETQDYFIGFGYDKYEKQAEMKERLVDFLIKTMEVVSDDQYEGIHDTHNGKELYLLKKKEIKRKHLHSFYRNGKYIYDYR